MKKPFVFISCGQYTEPERRLGKQVADIVRNLTGSDAFFAENVQDLNGLDDNILRALHDCAGLIVVLHPRGTITRPDGSTITRASVWIEQEIAIATYIQRIEKRQLPTIAFAHSDVDREGLRDLLQLNPIPFRDESDILSQLAAQLPEWKSLERARAEIRLLLTSQAVAVESGHHIRRFAVTLLNDTNDRVAQYNGRLCAPAEFVKHWNANYPYEVKPSPRPGYRCFNFDEVGRGPILPHDSRLTLTLDYCTACAVEAHGGVNALVSEAPIYATVWVKGEQYSVETTIRQMAKDAGH